MERPTMMEVKYGGRARANTSPSIATIPRPALIKYSSAAASLLLSHTHYRTYFLQTLAPESAIRHVLNWMTTQAEIMPPAPLPCPDQFDEAIWVLQVCKTLRVYPRFQGSDLEKEVRFYIRMAALTIGEFAMIFEVMAFVKDIRLLAVSETARRFRAGGVGRGVPDWEKIKAYCQENGIALDESAAGEGFGVLGVGDPSREDMDKLGFAGEPSPALDDE